MGLGRGDFLKLPYVVLDNTGNNYDIHAPSGIVGNFVSARFFMNKFGGLKIAAEV